MKLISKRGQSIGEYAILFGIVLGAVIAMQGYIRQRIAGTIQVEADNYGTTVYSPDVTSDSTSTTALQMQSARSGGVAIDSTSTSVTQH